MDSNKFNFIFNLKIITIICVVLLFSQFIAIVLSNHINNFLLLIIFSILIATIISFLICPECKIYIPRKSFFIILTSSIFVTLVLALRINWGIFDLICPHLYLE